MSWHVNHAFDFAEAANVGGDDDLVAAVGSAGPGDFWFPHGERAQAASSSIAERPDWSFAVAIKG